MEQLGKTRLAVDYWLSYPGPSQLFQATAEQAVASHKHLFCQNPGLLLPRGGVGAPTSLRRAFCGDKYKAMRSYGVEGVMQCWYFGNYPSLMSKAAGELAFEGAFADKEAFLRRLAGIYWGEQQADAAAAAWSAFEEGYRQYPVNIMFSYYGPMHDGPVWELQLTPKNFPSCPGAGRPSTRSTATGLGNALPQRPHHGGGPSPSATACGRAGGRGLSQLPAPSGYYPQDEQSLGGAGSGNSVSQRRQHSGVLPPPGSAWPGRGRSSGAAGAAPPAGLCRDGKQPRPAPPVSKRTTGWAITARERASNTSRKSWRAGLPSWSSC